MTAGLAKATAEAEAEASVIATLKVNVVSKIIYKVKVYNSFEDKETSEEHKLKKIPNGRHLIFIY